MVRERFSETNIHFAFMYMTYHLFTVILIKHLVNKDGEPTTPQKLATGKKPSVSNIRVLFCPCVLRKSTAYVDTKSLNMRHQLQKGFWGIFVEIAKHQKGHLIYVPSTWKIFSSHDVIFDEKVSSVFAYSSHPYSEALAIQPEVSYIPYTTSSHEQTGNIITFAEFEEGDLVGNECNVA